MGFSHFLTLAGVVVGGGLLGGATLQSGNRQGGRVCVAGSIGEVTFNGESR